MYRRYLIAAVAIMLVVSSLSFAQIDKIAIFNAQVSWTDAAAAAAATDVIMKNVKVANGVKVYDEAAIATFAKENTADGDLDIIITFGWFPTTLYPGGNAQKDGSVGELFLEGGNMFINTADYIFYVSNPLNEAAGLQNMTDSALAMWGDDPTTVATADGKTYTPSVVGVNFVANRPFMISELEAEPDWELEKAFATVGDKADPAIIRNIKYNGRVAIAFQAGGNLPRGEVISEMINNYVASNVTAVKANDKLPLTWGKIKTY